MIRMLLMLAACSTSMDTDYAKLLKEAKITLSDAIDRALKDVGGGTVVSAAIEQDDETGAAAFYIRILNEKQSFDLALDVKSGRVLEKESDQENSSGVASAVSVPMKRAIEIALKKISGTAVWVDLDVDRSEAPRITVAVYVDGGLKVVSIDAKTGEESKPSEASAEADPSKVLTPEQATKLVGKSVTVEFAVGSVGTSAKSGMVFVNAKTRDEKDEGFIAVIPKSARESFERAFGADLKAAFEGKTVQIKGTVQLYKGKAEIMLESADQIKVK